MGIGFVVVVLLLIVCSPIWLIRGITHFCAAEALNTDMLNVVLALKRVQDQLALLQHPRIKPKKVSVIKHRASRGDDVVNWVTPVTTVRL